MARTNIDLDERLVEEGLRVFKCKTKKELVHLALRELLKTEKNGKRSSNSEGSYSGKEILRRRGGRACDRRGHDGLDRFLQRRGDA